MSDKPNNISTDLRGIGNLAIDAILAITNLVEEQHQTISSFAGVLSASDQQRTKGITGLVYQGIRTVTGLVGKGIELPLQQLGSIIGENESKSVREAMISALNGVLGDHLVAKNNPLAISMQLRIDGESLDTEMLAKAVESSSGKLLIMVHGSSMNDLQWNREGHDHGAALARDLGFLPVYLRYNSGLHISENGRKLSELLEEVVTQLPKSVELYIVAHSMGGLVSRSACHYGKTSGHSWLKHLEKMIFLGTPHHGAPLEKGGNLADFLLEINPYSAAFSRLLKIRSSGVTDLRYGNVIDEDWGDRDRFELAGDQRTPVPLPKHVQCYAIASTTNKQASILGDDLVGDGLVTLNSALGRHDNPELKLLFPKDHQWVGRNINHWDLLKDQKLYDTLRKWLTPTSA